MCYYNYMNSKLIAANWKENPATEREALALFSATLKAKRKKGVEVAVFPPTVYLDGISKKFRALRAKRQLALGAQDIFWEETGAYTGQMGSLMLKQFGIIYVIIGHSERRKFANETDREVNKKVCAAQAAGLTVILCVGESLAVRKRGASAAKQFVNGQLVRGLGSRISDLGKPVIVAYEPIWAIGTGRNADPQDAVDMAVFIKKTLATGFGSRASAVLYGGSVNIKNVADYVRRKEIDGALIGGASVRPQEIAGIIEKL